MTKTHKPGAKPCRKCGHEFSPCYGALKRHEASCTAGRQLLIRDTLVEAAETLMRHGYTTDDLTHFSKATTGEKAIIIDDDGAWIVRAA